MGKHAVRVAGEQGFQANLLLLSIGDDAAREFDQVQAVIFYCPRADIATPERGAGSVVLRTGAAGIEDFDRKAQPAAPSIWVTAPTRGTPARGALLNAPFQIDTGRATLALGKSATQINTALAQTLAKEVSPALIALQAESETNWTVLAAELGCAQSVSKAGLLISKQT